MTHMRGRPRTPPARRPAETQLKELRILLRDEEVTAVQRPPWGCKHGLSTHSARSPLRDRHPRPKRRLDESAELALATQQERNEHDGGHAVSTPGRILRSD